MYTFPPSLATNSGLSNMAVFQSLCDVLLYKISFNGKLLGGSRSVTNDYLRQLNTLKDDVGSQREVRDKDKIELLFIEEVFKQSND